MADRLREDWSEQIAGVLSNPDAPGTLRELGVEDPLAVRLAMAERVPEAVRNRIEELRTELVRTRPQWTTAYEGVELTLP